MSKPSDIIAELIECLDDEPEREGLAGTPLRYERFIKEFFDKKPINMTTFKNEGYDEMVIQANIPFYSICEHHLIPFFGYGTIAYLPGDRIVGLSKLTRTLDHFSRRLQNQERITMQVAEYLEEKLKPKGVGVVLTARHMCMEMRGVEKPCAKTTTSCLKGYFKTSPSTRSEFFQIIQNNSLSKG
jgi:GTP cyclohydrolase I